MVNIWYYMVLYGIIWLLYDGQWEGWHPIYEMENIQVMFQTTKQ